MSLRDRLRRARTVEPPVATDDYPPLVSDADQAIVDQANPFTMTSSERLLALVDAVRYAEHRGLEGAFVECGVWKGGSILAMILTLQDLGRERDIYLFDTFEGMTEPSEHDVSRFHRPALEDWTAAGERGELLYDMLFRPDQFSEQGVREVLLATGYPSDRLHFVRGPVEETVPANAPGQLALLRLDTDWYESTKHELEHLYPRLTQGGVLIIDDYGHWDGARKAVDEYFAGAATPVLLNRIDYAGRLAIKDRLEGGG